MTSLIGKLALASVVAIALPQLTLAQGHRPAQPQSSKAHHVVIQIDQNDTALMNLALNNAENMRKFYETKGEKIDIEFVAFGPGLSMMRSDVSPVQERLAEMSKKTGITFSGCGNTLTNQSRAEHKELSLLPEARVVPTGVARIIELQEQGWTYLRP